MNYKIRITEENQAIVKRIADENGMNPYNFNFHETYLYEIQNNQFVYMGTIQKGEEETILTTEQFIELFDKKETEPHICKYCQAETTQDDETCYAKPTEWQPKRGDKVLVWDDNNYCERIFLAEIKKSEYPIVTVHHHYEKDFLNDDVFSVVCFKQMKPLLIEQPTETDFKSKVIELIEKRIAICIESIDEYKKLNSFSSCEVWRNCKHENQELLKQIKEL